MLETHIIPFDILQPLDNCINLYILKKSGGNMGFVIASTAMIFVVLLTFFFFICIGRPSESLLTTKTVVLKWKQKLSHGTQAYITISNIFSTITSLATVYIFFLGSAKIFGIFAFACCLSLILGGYISNLMTNRLLKLPAIKNKLTSDLPQSSVVAALFYTEEADDKKISSLVKYISLVGISCSIWLEFAVFGDIFGKLFFESNIIYSCLSVGICAFAVLFFTTKYGLQGFVFADALHGLIIGIAIVSIVIQLICFSTDHTVAHSISLPDFFSSLASPIEIVLFLVHVFLINAFFVILAESHWLRLWLFEEKEVKYQIRAQALTAFLWGGIIFAGLSAYSLVGKTETDLVADTLLKFLALPIPFVYAFFWMGAIAALFSTADGQLYCFFLVRAFDPKRGLIPDKAKRIRDPFLFSISAGTLFALVYFVVRFLEIPFEKIVFSVMPITMNLLPALLPLVAGKKPKICYTVYSLVIYSLVVFIGLLIPSTALYASLGAIVVPILFSLCSAMNSRR